MGSSVSLEIKTDGDGYYSGDMVTGKLFITARKSFRLETIEVFLVGIENSRVHARSSSETVAPCSHTYLRLKATVDCGLDWVDKGLHLVPFSVALPQLDSLPFLPNTKCSVDTVKFWGSIEISHTLEVSVRSRMGVVSGKCSIQILGHRRQALLPFISPIPATFCREMRTVTGGFEGTIALGLFVKQSLLGAGEIFTVNYAIENYSNATIKALEFYVFEDIRWTADANARFGQKELFRRRIEMEQLAETHDLAPLRKKHKGETTTVPADEAINQLLVDCLEGGVHTCQAQVGHEAKPSFTGQFVTVSHTVLLKCCTGFGSENFAVAQVITVHRDAIPVTERDPHEISSSLLRNVRVHDESAGMSFYLSPKAQEQEQEAPLPVANILFGQDAVSGTRPLVLATHVEATATLVGSAVPASL